MTAVKPPGKWIQGIDGSTPLIEAAKAIVELRLEPVVTLLPLASARHAEDVEYIHQLRVASRRADAALKAFRLSFGAKRWRKVHRRLRTIRRAAGAARTCDVHIMALAERLEQAPEEHRGALAYALSRTQQERRQAQDAVDDAARRFPEARLRKGHGKLLDSARLVTGTKLGGSHRLASAGALGPTLLDAAMHQLPRAMHAVHDAAERDMRIFENLHQLRIESKHLRYSMEIFATCFDERFRKVLYPQMKVLQDHLGTINDAHEMALRFERYAASCTAETPAEEEPALHAGLERLAVAWRKERALLSEVFLQWWAEFRTSGTLSALEEYLGAGSPKA